MKVVTAIQARTSSSRLPYKVLLPLCGEPLLLRMIERIRHSDHAGTIVVATSISKEDDVIEQLCFKQGINCCRGNLLDLLDRHYQLAVEYEADAIVKIPSDCPLIDPAIIDRVIKYYLDHFSEFDFVSNLHPPTFPDGNDVEIMSFETIKTAWENAVRPLEREHTTPYIWENPQKFKIGNVTMPFGEDYSATHRWTIDYEEDYQFICEVYNSLYEQNPIFGFDEIMALVEEHPEFGGINDQYHGLYWYENHMNELITIDHYKNKKHNHES